ncbi:MAG: exodeoxyribonuclease VII small subunit [Parachlamydiales bacterium]|jgi:exodeoxyribonuclease VII small subunit
MEQKNLPFEKAFERLENILTEMNSGKLSLEDALKHFEEADNLIGECQKKLGAAEEKIEVLLKGRKNELILDADQKPIAEPLQAEEKTSL